MKTITKTAISNLKHNKNRSILIGIAIMLTTCLLMIIGTSAIGVVKYSVANAGLKYGNFHGGYFRVTEEQVEKIKHHAEFTEVGITETIATLQIQKADGTLVYMDDKAYGMGNMVLEEGHMPHNENEIVAQKELFEYLGSTAKVGDTVTLYYRVKGEGEILEKDFVICGILSSSKLNNLRKMYGAVVSKDFCTSTIPKEERSFDVLFNILGEDTLTYEEMQNNIKDLAETLGIKKSNIRTNDGYLRWVTDPGTEVIVSCLVIGILVMLFSTLVIYNIFYVGIIQKVQEFGKLRAMGTTKKQLKGIILREGMILALFSIPIGILLGYLISNIGFEYLIFKLMEEMISIEIAKISLFNFPIILLVVTVSLLTVYLSLKKPMKIASTVSPVEAIKFQGDNDHKIKKRNGYETVNLYRLTMSNIVRNKKRTVTTILTMGLSCVLFVTIANLASSMSAEYATRRTIEKGDFHIELNYKVDDKTYLENNLNYLQQQNFMGNDFIKEIKGIDGVTKVETRNTLLAKISCDSYPENNRMKGINVLSREDYQARKKDCKRGIIDYDKAVMENGIAYTYDYFFEELGYEIGDKIKFELYDGDKIIPFEATLQASTTSTDTTFIMTEDTLKQLGFKGNLTTHTFIYCEKDKENTVESALNSIVGRSEYYNIESFSNALHISKFSIRMTTAPIYGLLSVLGIIGFMNMANTLITSIVTRKREFGILQAIGLTNKQLVKMIQAEGLVFTIGTLIVSLTVGNVFGYWFFLYAKDKGIIGVNTYHFPLVEIVIMVVVLLGMQMFLSFYLSKNIQKEALIERIRYQE